MGKNNLDKACLYVGEKIGETPKVAIILGSGLASLGDILEQCVKIPYSQIPGFPLSTAPGHDSTLLCGSLNGNPVIVFQGRFHHYEGYSMERIAYPIRFLSQLGCKTLIVTNAAGGINRSFVPGDLMVISDHININGLNPLMGTNDDLSGTRFPHMTRAYSRDLRALLLETAENLDIRVKEGVYGWTTGPSFETPAEIKMLRILGAHVVGMSTVPEVITAVHGGLDVLGISCVSNMAAGILDQPITAEEVMEIGRQVSGRFSELICGFISLYYKRISQ